MLENGANKEIPSFVKASKNKCEEIPEDVAIAIWLELIINLNIK